MSALKTYECNTSEQILLNAQYWHSKRILPYDLLWKESGCGQACHDSFLRQVPATWEEAIIRLESSACKVIIFLGSLTMNSDIEFRTFVNLMTGEAYLSCKCDSNGFTRRKNSDTYKHVIQCEQGVDCESNSWSSCLLSLLFLIVMPYT